MVIGFNPRFKEPIIAGTKIHTIRQDQHNRWKAGMVMHMATGVRTKNYSMFCAVMCKSTQAVEIIGESDELNGVIVKVDGRALSLPEVKQLAWNDGFDNLADFWRWFSDDFTGKILHWTELRY